MKVALIVAMDAQRGIGRDNDLMWHLPADMRFFKETTAGQVVIMGRKNWDSIPLKYRPLANRENVVLTRNTELKLEGAKVFHTLNACLDSYAQDERVCFIIGGGEIYKMALEMNCVEEMYITEIDHVYGADTFFPALDETKWDKALLSFQEINEKHNASFSIYKYTRK